MSWKKQIIVQSENAVATQGLLIWSDKHKNYSQYVITAWFYQGEMYCDIKQPVYWPALLTIGLQYFTSMLI